MQADRLRCYHFNNFYFQGIHAGIQSHHALMEIQNKSRIASEYRYMDFSLLDEWAEHHKTVVVLNGGMQSNLEELANFLDINHCKFPWASFREAKDAANETMTNIGIILPDYIFKMSRIIVPNHPKSLFERGIGDGETFNNNSLSIKVMKDGFIKVSYTPDEEGFSFVKNTLTDLENPTFKIEERFYSPFEIELMARISRCGLMS